MTAVRSTRFHIVGIGGAGMSAVARVLMERGHQITGSDNGHWPLAEALARDGAAVHERFSADHVPGADIVIRSSAYKEDNVEVRAALDRGMTVWKREDAWRFLTKGQRVVAIAGTHGKSTTTAMTWLGLRAGGVDASLICGAAIRGVGTNAHAGKSDVFVIEADEYDNTFLALQPEVAVVTTLDHDHVDMFPTRESYRDAFRAFVKGALAGSLLIASADDAGARELAAWTREQHSLRVTTYGKHPSADRKLVDHGNRAYDLGGRLFSLSVPGWHNALNAAAAIIVADHFSAPTADVLARGLAPFEGVERRLELLGTAGTIKVIDDYAHHPSEIAAGLDAFGESAVVVFQPHTPSRLAAFFDDFVMVLKRARAVVIVETFRSAREQADPHGRARKLAEAVGGRYAPDGETAAHLAAEMARPGDAVLVMGAGDVRPVGERVLELLRTPV
ncbi:MAG: UDP-N-acetylmuramate--L-alanine ligase [Chloroflexi bacterium]|nr:MAG: UDP-N-acetylmuramate--L-alanine ligase [Chloroflexota bacterium]TMC33371.1 MAG: UDP-N-acetylmuramate--L-alanine ligase [Chloroflexota bacterium]TME43391.1 MAG: UDP-N-acetylmuramate--L-alanine ligase [Chloroflexota bacterium]